MKEQTLIMLKPCAIRRRIVGKLISIFEDKNLDILKIVSINFNQDMIKDFYAQYVDSKFFNEISDYMTSGVVLAIILEGEDIIANTRNIIGATNPILAVPGTIRSRFATSIRYNLIHSSDSLENVQRERKILNI